MSIRRRNVLKRLPSFVYDAPTVGRVLNLPCNCSEEVPKAADGEVVVWYGGWTLGALVATGKVVKYLNTRNCWKAPAGYYHTRIPVPDSNWMPLDEQLAFLARLYPALKELPTPVGATALAVHLGVTGENLLEGYLKANMLGGFSCRCEEKLPGRHHGAIDVCGGIVRVGRYWDGGKDDKDGGAGHIFLGAARMS